MVPSSGPNVSASPSSPPPESAPSPSKFLRALRKFTCIFSAPRELWIIYAAYLLENLAYKCGAASVLTLWLSHDLGFNDMSASSWIFTWSSIMTLITVLVGALVLKRLSLFSFTCPSPKKGAVSTDGPTGCLRAFSQDRKCCGSLDEAGLISGGR